MAVIGSRFSSLFNDSNGDAKVSPGDVLLTQIVITNATATPLTTVVVNDTLTANTTYVAGTIIVTTGDTYALTGNTPATFGAGGIGPGLLANDYHGDGANVNTSTGLSVASVNGTAIGGAITVKDAANNALTAGSVNVGADGTFTFTPAAGYTGTAAFTYSISDGSGIVGSATVHLGVTGLVWYVDGSAAGGGDGTFGNPFNNLASVSAVDHTTDTVVLHGTVTTAAAFVMKTGEILYGDGSTYTVNGHAITTGSATDSTINHSAGGITLASGNTIDGVDLSGTTAAATGVTDGGATVGALTINHMAIGGQGQILDIDQGGTLNVALKSAGSTGFSGVSQGGAIDLQGVTGAVTVAGTTSITGTQTSGGIDVAAAGLTATFTGATTLTTGATAALTLAGGTANFNGGAAITTTTGAALTTTGGTLNIASGSISTTTGHIVDMTNTTVGTVVLTSLASSAAVVGSAIKMDNVDGGTFGVTTVNVAGAAGDGIHIGTGSSTAFTLGNTTIAAITNGNQGIDISGNTTAAGAANVTFNGNVSVTTTTGASGVVIDGNNGAVTFSGTSVVVNSGIGNGVSISNNSATVGFSGANLNVDSTSGTAFSAAQGTGTGGALNITGSSNSIASTTGRAINIDGVTANVTLHDVSVTGGGTTTGVFLKNTGSGGQFVVTGDSVNGNGSGGTIANITGADVGSAGGAANTGTGIYMENVSNVSLSHMNIGSATAGQNLMSNYGIRGEAVTNFTLKDSIFSGNFGDNGAQLEGTIRFGTQSSGGVGLTGTALFSGNNIQGGFVHNLSVTSYGSGTLNMTVNDSATRQGIFGNTSAGSQGASDVEVETGGTTTLNFTSIGVDYNGSHDFNLHVVSDAQTVQNINISNNVFNNLQTQTSGAGNIAITGQLLSTNTATNGIVHYTIDSNVLKGANGSNIFGGFNGTGGTVTGVITNNTVGTLGGGYQTALGTTGSLNGGLFFGGIDGKQSSASTYKMDLRIEGNHVYDTNSAGGVILLRSSADDNTGTERVEATIKNNVASEFGGNIPSFIYAQPAGSSLNAFGTLGMEISGNNVTFASGAQNSGLSYDGSNGTSTFYMPGFSGTSDNAGVAAFLASKANVFTNANPAVNYLGPTVGNKALVDPVPLTVTTPSGQGWQDFVQDKAPSDPSVTTDPSDTTGGTGGTTGGTGGTTGGTGGTGSTTTTPPTEVTSALTQDALDQMVSAAIHRWELAGATPEQIAAMKAVTVTISNIAGLEVGDSTPGHVQISTNGAGYGWFVDATPGDDAEFTGTGSDLTAAAGSAAAGHIDLLTVLEHELGHQIGLSDLYSPLATADLMYGYINPSERRLPTSADVGAANGTAIDHEAFALAPVTIPSLGANTDVDISYRATVNSFAAGLAPTLSGQSTMTWQGLATPITASETIGRLNTSRTDSAGTVTTNALTEATLTLGNLVFKDNDKSGTFNAGDTGIGNVVVKLYVDTNANGVYDAGTDTFVAQTTTSNVAGTLGQYTFTGLAPGDYVAVIPATNFAAGQPLNTLVPHNGAIDPDTGNVDNDNNGIAVAGGDVASQAITLAFDTEPTPGAGNDTNNTLDFGFQVNTPPTAVNDTLNSTNEDTPATYAATDFTGNDSDPDGDTFTITSVGNGAHGTAVLNGNGTVTYTPAANYNGADSFSYTITDSHGATATANASLTVNAVNDAPTATIAPPSGGFPPLGTETRANTTTAGDQVVSGVAGLAGGGHVVVWQSPDASGTGIFMQRYDTNGTALGVESQVNTTTANNQMSPAVTALNGGGYVVTWNSVGQDGSAGGIYMQRYDSSGVAQGGETQVHTSTAGDQQLPSVAALANGGYVVVWFGPDADGDGIFGQRFDASGVPQGGQFAINNGTVGEQQLPTVTGLTGGGFAVTWFSDSEDGSGQAALVRLFDASGTAQGNASVANTFTTNDQSYSSIGALADGGYVVTWESFGEDGSGYGVYAQRYDSSGAKVGAEFRVNATTALNQEVPSVVGLDDGGFVISWRSNGQDGSDYGIFARHYAADGSTTGPDIQVNTFTTGAQYNPKIDNLSNGGVVISWHSLDQDGSGWGIYAQRFASGFIATEQVATNLKGTLSVADVDGGAGSETVTLSVDYGVLHLTAGSSGAVVSNDGTSSVTVTGTVAQINALLSTDGTSVVTYTANTDTPPASAHLTLHIDDNGNTGGGNLSAQTTSTIAIVGVNDAPSGADESLHVVDNATHVFTVAEFTNGYTDVDGNSLNAVKIDSLPVKGTLTDNNVAVTVGQFVSVADIAAGKLVYTPDPTTGGNAYNFKFQVQDDGGTANGGVNLDPTQHTYTLNVDVSNNAPVAVGEALADAYEDEPTIYSEATLLAGDSDPDAGDTIHVTGAGNAQHGTVSYDAVTHAVTFTSDLNYSGPAQFDYTITDSHGGTSTATDTLTVLPTNDAPTITGLDGDTNTQTEDHFDDMYIDVGANAVVADIDSTDFDGGSLVVSIANYNGEDSIGIYQDGILEIDGSNNVLVNGVAIGVASGGYLDIPHSGTFTIAFNANATPANVQELVRHIFAGDQRSEPDAGTRTVNITLTDGDGNAHGGTDHSDYSTTFTIVSVNDEPVGADKTVTINEDNAYALQTGDFGFQADASGFESGNLQAVKITTLPTGGTLYLDTDGAGTGTLGTAITAGQFVSAADIAAGHLVYVPAQDVNGTGAASFTFQVQDDGGIANGGVDTDQSPNTITFDINAVNDAPAYSGATAGSGSEDGSITFSTGTANAIIVTDVDGGAPYTATLTVGHGVLAATASGAANVTGAGSGTLTVTGTLADVNATLDGLIYTPAADFNEPDTLHISTQDSGGNANGSSDTGTTDIALTITPVNDPPTIAGLDGDAVSFTENDAVVYTDAAANGTTAHTLVVPGPGNALVTDIDSADFAGASLVFSISAGAVAGEDRVGFVGFNSQTAGAISFSGSNIYYGNVLFATSSGTLTSKTYSFNANATPQMVTALVHQLVYIDTSDNPNTGDRTLQYVLSDGDGGTTTAHSTVHVTAVNDNPVLDLDSSQPGTGANNGLFEQDPSGSGGIAYQAVVTDVDSPNFDTGTLTVSLTANGQSGDKIDVSSYFSDPGNSHTVTTSGNQILFDGTVVATYTAGDMTTPLVITFNANSTPLSAGWVARAVDVTFINDDPSSAVRTLHYVLTDGDGGTASADATYNVTAANDAPQLSAPTNASVSFTENNAAVAILQGVVLTDPDNPTNFSTGSIDIAVTGTPGGLNLKAGSNFVIHDNGNSTFTLMGPGNVAIGDITGFGTTHLQITNLTANATPAVLNDLIDDWTFSIAGDDVADASGTITLTFNDGHHTGYFGDTALTATQTQGIDVTGLNDAPVNNVPGATQQAVEDSSLTFNAANSNLISVSDADDDGGSLTVTLSVAHGTLNLSTTASLSFSTGDGTSDATMTFSGTKAAINTALNGLVYTPTGDFNGDDSLSITTNDNGNSGDGPAGQDVDTVAIHVNAVNDAPVASGSATAPAIDEDMPSATGDTVGGLFASNYSDQTDNQSAYGGSFPGAMGGIAITGNGSSGATGQWQYWNGAAWTDIGAVSDSSALTISAGTTIRFNPAQDYNGAAPTLTVHLADNTVSISDGAHIDLSAIGATGGTTAWSAGTVDLDETINPVNDAPVLDLNGAAAGTDTDLSFNEGDPALHLAPAGTVVDVDSPDFDGATLTVQFTSGSSQYDQLIVAGLDPDAGGQIFNGSAQVIATVSGGTDPSDPLVITFTSSATASDVQNVLHMVAYADYSNAMTSGDRTISFVLTDGDGGTSNLATSTVHVTAVDSPAVLNDDQANTDELSTVIVPVTANDSDPDGPPPAVTKINGNAISSGQTITLPSGAKLTLNADGTLTYDPNHQYDTLTSTAGGETGASNTQAADSFSYTTQDGSTASVTVTIDGVANAADHLEGSNGNDVVTGTPHADYFDFTQGGSDSGFGLGGDDAFYFGAAYDQNDKVDGGAGTDTVGIRGNYTGGNAVTILGGNMVGVEVLSLMTSTGGPVGYDITWKDGNLATNQKMSIYAGNLQVGENATFNGSAETHGYFLMYGGLGNDHFVGGAGSDGFYFGPGKFSQADFVDGGGGAQNQLGLDGSYNFSAASALGTLGGNFVNIQTIVLYGGDPRDVSNPYPNVYHIETNDLAVAAGKTLNIYGAQTIGDFYFNGSAETDGAFNILAGSGNDTLIGGAGNDTIYGGLGSDTLTGGAGNDVFVFTDVAQSIGANVDRITDFTLGDKINLAQIDADTNQAGDQAFTFIGSGTFTNHAGELRAEYDAAHDIWTVQGDVNGDGVTDITIVVHTTDAHPLAGTDFFL